MTNDLRQEVLAITELLIRERGTSSVSFRELADLIEVPETSIRTEFESINTLIVQVIAQRGPRFTERFPPAGHGEVADNLGHFAAGVIRFYRHGMPLFAAVSADSGIAGGLRQALPSRADVPAPVFQVLSQYVKEEQGLGRINTTVDPMMLAIAIVGACFMWAFMEYATGRLPFGPMEGQKYIDDVLRNLGTGWHPERVGRAA
jgi:AcrR family transcriptional regulator